MSTDAFESCVALAPEPDSSAGGAALRSRRDHVSLPQGKRYRGPRGLCGNPVSPESSGSKIPSISPLAPYGCAARNIRNTPRNHSPVGSLDHSRQRTRNIGCSMEIASPGQGSSRLPCTWVGTAHRRPGTVLPAEARLRPRTLQLSLGQQGIPPHRQKPGQDAAAPAGRGAPIWKSRRPEREIPSRQPVSC